MSDVLFTRPDHDIITHYLHAWSQDLIDTADQQGHTVLDLAGDDATGQTLQSHIQAMDPGLLVLNGHGTSTSVHGHDDEPILTTDHTDLLQDRLLYVRTCRSGQELGPDCTGEDGANAFIGYDQDFILIRDTRSTADPLDDDAAAPILRAANRAPDALLQGDPAGETYQKSQDQHRQEMQRVLADYDLGRRAVFNALAANREGQVLHGDPDAQP